MASMLSTIKEQQLQISLLKKQLKTLQDVNIGLKGRISEQINKLNSERCRFRSQLQDVAWALIDKLVR